MEQKFICNDEFSNDPNQLNQDDIAFMDDVITQFFSDPKNVFISFSINLFSLSK